MKNYSEEIETAVKEIAASMKGRGSLRVISAGAIPVTEYAGNPDGVADFTMEALKNPTPDKKDVYEAFFDYAEKLKENHPAWDSESYIKARFGSAYEKMAEIAPEAYQKYEQKLHPQEISQKKNYIKPETTISYN